MFCANCGNSLKDSTQYCRKCGHIQGNETASNQRINTTANTRVNPDVQMNPQIVANDYQAGNGYQAVNGYQAGNDYQAGNHYQTKNRSQAANTYQDQTSLSQSTPAYTPQQRTTKGGGQNKTLIVAFCVVLALAFFMETGRSNSGSSSSGGSIDSSSNSTFIENSAVKSLKLSLASGSVGLLIENHLTGVEWKENFLGDGEYIVTVTGYSSKMGETIVFTYDVSNVDPYSEYLTLADVNLNSIYLKNSGKYLTDILDIQVFLMNFE